VSIARISAQLQRLTLIALLATASCKATIVVVTLTHDAIYVGADERLTEFDQNGNETDSTPTTCKLRKFGNVVVGYSGWISYPEAGLDVWKTFGSTRAASVSDFAHKIGEELPQQFQGIYKKYGPRIGMPADVAVLGFEEGRPAFIRVLFIP
jgi:hypothetical protein